MKKLLLGSILGLFVSSSMICTPIHNAAYYNDLSGLQQLLSVENVNSDDQDEHGWTPLHYAVMNPLHDDVMRDNTETVQLLLANNAKPDILDYGNKTPLFFAVTDNNEEAARLLVNKGADPRKGTIGINPMSKAIKTNNRGMIELLLTSHHVQKSDLGSYLSIAIFYNNDEEIIELFLERGADTNSEDKTSGWTPLHFAAINLGENNANIVRILLNRKANPKLPNKEGCTPLHHAAWKNNTTIAEILCEAGANPNAPDNKGRTPFMVCGIDPYTN